MKLICLGHATVDTIYRVGAIPVSPTKVLAKAYAEAGGGMAANASIAPARLGADVAFRGKVGDDPFGDRIVAWLEAEGVDVRALRRIAGARSPHTLVMVDDRGERLICAYDDPSLDDDASWLPIASVASCDAVLSDVRWRAGAARILDAARAARVPSVLDADVAPVESLRDLCARCDYAIFSEPGLARASGVPSPGEGLLRMQQRVSGAVGVTLGSEGFLWFEAGRECRLAPPSVDVVDTLAAGDVFHAAFAIAIAERRSIAGATAFANAAAALKCTREGGRDRAPTRGEVESLLARQRGASLPAS